LIVVVDTNVLVSGLLTSFHPPARMVDQIVAQSINVAFDDRIIAEYEEVLARPKFQFEPSQAKAIVDHIRLNGVLVSAAPLGVKDLPDLSDLPFGEVAVAAHADALVTGDKGHFDYLEAFGVPVLSPAEFMELLDNLAAGDP